MSQKVNVIIADDHQIVRDGIRSLLEGEQDIMVAGEAEDGEDVLTLLKEAPADLVIMDINMPRMDGISCTRIISTDFPDTKVLALTMLIEDQHVKAMIHAGASGYIMKNSGKDELLKAIRRIMEGKHYFSDEATNAIMQDLIQPGGKKDKDEGDHVPLTEREIEILRLISQEMTNEEIGKKLFISRRTVDAHRRNLLEKTGSRNTAGLIKYALKHNLID
jgi:DNA-binding NarL/FixJ family response regulator